MSYRFIFHVDSIRNPPSGSGPLSFRDETVALAVHYMLAPRSIGCGPLSLHQADGYAVVLAGGAPTVSGYRYPRNGNLGNPTPVYRWEVRQSGRLVGTACTLKGARELIAEFND